VISARKINAQHTKNAKVVIQITKGKLSPPKEAKKWHDDELGDL
jgi:hypothetical protein